MSTNEKLIAAANHLVDDLNMLMDGSWEPDADSCQASIDNAVLLADGLPVLIERLRVAEEAAQQLDKAAMILADESDYMLNRVDTVLREVGYWTADDDTN